MTYTVVWKPAAEEELARMWTDAFDRSAITMAADAIDQLLKSDPLAQGESRSGAIRIVFIHPLGMFFHVEEQDRIVSVLRVWSVT